MLAALTIGLSRFNLYIYIYIYIYLISAGGRGFWAWSFLLFFSLADHMPEHPKSNLLIYLNTCK